MWSEDTPNFQCAEFWPTAWQTVCFGNGAMCACPQRCVCCCRGSILWTSVRSHWLATSNPCWLVRVFRKKHISISRAGEDPEPPFVVPAPCIYPTAVLLGRCASSRWKWPLNLRRSLAACFSLRVPSNGITRPTHFGLEFAKLTYLSFSIF